MVMDVVDFIKVLTVTFITLFPVVDPIGTAAYFSQSDPALS